MKNLIKSYQEKEQFQIKDLNFFILDEIGYKYNEIIIDNNEIRSYIPFDIKEKEILVETTESINSKWNIIVKIIFNFNQD